MISQSCKYSYVTYIVIEPFTFDNRPQALVDNRRFHVVQRRIEADLVLERQLVLALFLFKVINTLVQSLT